MRLFPGEGVMALLKKIGELYVAYITFLLKQSEENCRRNAYEREIASNYVSYPRG